MDNQEIKNSTSQTDQILTDKAERKPVSFFWIFKLIFNSLKKIKLSKKTTGIILLAVFIAGIVWVIGKKFDLRLDFSIQKINYQNYNHIGPDFSFRYPDYYVFDGDEEKKYGIGYMGGFRLISDQRTGCDVRQSETMINFQKTDQEIQSALEENFKKSVKNFELIKTERRKIGGEDAFNFEFSFTDPLGSTAHLSQVITAHDNVGYLLVCGTGDYQYKYFQKDFTDFLDSFQWKGAI